MHDRMTISDLRKLPSSLDGVKLTTKRVIQLGAGKTIMPGIDVTSTARHWPNLGLLIKRGDVGAEPPVDYRSLVITPAPQESPKQEDKKPRKTKR